MIKVVFLSDIIESNGKTVKENNLAKQHKFNIGDLVEFINSKDMEDCAGVRMYIVAQNRDCDGTPLYCLCHDKSHTTVNCRGFRNLDWISGYGEESLRLIKHK